MRHLEIIIDNKVRYTGPELDLYGAYVIVFDAIMKDSRIEIIRTWHNGNRDIVIVEGEAVTRRHVKLLNSEK